MAASATESAMKPVQSNGARAGASPARSVSCMPTTATTPTGTSM
jgi:hypothetical protein